jgi:hypothetical protein
MSALCRVAAAGSAWAAYLARGNAQLLETLHRRFVSGPIDWAKEWGGTK